ncbi:MAG: class I SAM-dependent methyltransferase [Baekduiaceae bacterium]
MAAGNDLTYVSWVGAREELSRFVADQVASDRPLEVVEAGCGRCWDLFVDPSLCRITGIDTDEQALTARIEGRGDLHVPVVGDVQDASMLPAESVDLVYSAFVLEHLPRAEEALEAWVSWLRPGGHVIAILPDAQSIYGFLSSRTPHGFHVWVYRNVFRRKRAGQPGFAPYPVSYSRLMTARGMREFADEHGLDIVAAYRIGEMRADAKQLSPRRVAAIEGFKRLLGALTLGRLAGRHDNIAFVFGKPERVSEVTPLVAAST